MGPVCTLAERTVGCITGGGVVGFSSLSRCTWSRSMGLSRTGEVPDIDPLCRLMRAVSCMASAASATCGPDSTSHAGFSAGGVATGAAFRTASRSARLSNGFSKYASAP